MDIFDQMYCGRHWLNSTFFKPVSEVLCPVRSRIERDAILPRFIKKYSKLRNLFKKNRDPSCVDRGIASEYKNGRCVDSLKYNVPLCI
jgi:hypothetical protein